MTKLLLIALMIAGCGFPTAEFDEYSGVVDKVEYLDKGGFGGVPRTIVYFDSGAVVPLCGTKIVALDKCHIARKVKNKICHYDHIIKCESERIVTGKQLF